MSRLPKRAKVYDFMDSRRDSHPGKLVVTMQEAIMNPSIHSYPDTVAMLDCARFFGFSARTASRLANQGAIDVRSAGRQRFIMTHSVRMMILQKTQESPETITSYMKKYYGVPALIHISSIDRVFSFSRSTGYRLADRRKILAINIGSARFVVTDSVMNFFARHNIAEAAVRDIALDSCRRVVGAAS